MELGEYKNRAVILHLTTAVAGTRIVKFKGFYGGGERLRLAGIDPATAPLSDFTFEAPVFAWAVVAEDMYGEGDHVSQRVEPVFQDDAATTTWNGQYLGEERFEVILAPGEDIAAWDEYLRSHYASLDVHQPRAAAS
jgi:hypothetical protein